MNKKVIYLFVIIGFVMGFAFNSVSIVKDTPIYLNGDTYKVRDENGSELYPIEKDNVLYLPVSQNESYLDYMTVPKDNDVYLYDVGQREKFIDGFHTESIYGDEIDNTVFRNSEYSVVTVWSTECGYCKNMLTDFVNLNEFFESENIQFITILHNITDVFDEDIREIEDIYGDLVVDYTLLRDDVIDRKLNTASISLPKTFIVDNEGYVVKIIDKTISSEELETILTHIKG